MGTELLMEGYRDEHSHLVGLEHWQGIWFSLLNSENYLWHSVGASERLEKIDESWLENKNIIDRGWYLSAPREPVLFSGGERRHHFAPLYFFTFIPFLSFSFIPPWLPFALFPLAFLFLFLSSRSASTSTEQKLPSFGLLGINQHRETLESVT